jgi:hypothetical protein
MQLQQLFSSYQAERAAGDDDPELLLRLRGQLFPELPDLNATDAAAELRDKLRGLEAKRAEMAALKKKLVELQAQKLELERRAAGHPPAHAQPPVDTPGL